MTNGGRVLGVTATADRLTAAITQAYAAAENIHVREAAQADGHRIPGPESNCGERITAALYNLSVIAARCHLSRSERLWQAVTVYKKRHAFLQNDTSLPRARPSGELDRSIGRP